MQLMADFLLEPSAKQSAGKAKNTLLETNNQAASNAPKFSNIYAQQQQARGLAAKNEPAKPQAVAKQAQSSAKSPDTKPSSVKEQKTAQSKPDSVVKNADTTVKDETKTVADEQQGQEVDSQSGKDLPAQADKKDESLVAQLDPLLLQIMQAQQMGAEHSAEIEEPVAELLTEPQADPVLVGMANAMSTMPVMDAEQLAHKSAGTMTGTPMQGSAALMQAGSAGEAEESELNELSELEPLDLAMGVEEDAKLTQVLAQSVATQAKGETKQAPAQLVGEVKTGVENTARNETLMRAESVQQANAARQVPGQPLAMNQPGWSKELTDKVMWMSSQNLKSAEIKLNPAELGRLDIRVEVNNDQTQITFTSAHAGVRESLESQSFRLRELMAQQGMQDVDVNVADQSETDQRDERELRELMAEQHSGIAQQDEEDVVQTVTEVPQVESGHSGRLSYYV